MALKRVQKYVLVDCKIEELKAGDLFQLEWNDGVIFFAESNGKLDEKPTEPGKGHVVASWLDKCPVDSEPKDIRVESNGTAQ